MQYPTLPDNCPQCGKNLPSLRRRSSTRMQKKAALLFLASLPLLIALTLLGVVILAALTQHARISIFAIIPLFALVTSPAMYLGKIAWDMPRILGVSCRGCGWKDDFLMQRLKSKRRRSPSSHDW